MMLHFGVISGIGWLIDFSVFSGLAWAGVPVWAANMAGASIAVLFVFFSSVRRVFRYQGSYLLGKLIAYIAYQVVAITLASLLIDALTQWMGIAPLLSKVLVTPLTFYANFQFMSFITTGRLRLLP